MRTHEQSAFEQEMFEEEVMLGVYDDYELEEERDRYEADLGNDSGFTEEEWQKIKKFVRGEYE